MSAILFGKRSRELEAILQAPENSNDEIQKTDFGSLSLIEILNDPQWAFLEEDTEENEPGEVFLGQKELMASIMEDKFCRLDVCSEQNLKECNEEDEKRKKTVEEIIEKNEEEEKYEEMIDMGVDYSAKKHPFRKMEEESSRIVEKIRTFNLESKFVVTKYFESRRHLLSISNYEKGELKELNEYLSSKNRKIKSFNYCLGNFLCGCDSGVFIRYHKTSEGSSFSFQEYHSPEALDSSVSCIDMSSDQKYIASGHDQGLISFWEASPKRLLKNIQKSSSSIRQVRVYVAEWPCCIWSNEMGEVYRTHLVLRKTGAFEESTQLVLTSQSVSKQLNCLNLFGVRSDGVNYLLMACASESRVHVSSVEPEISKQFEVRSPKDNSKSQGPLVSWCFGHLLHEPNKLNKTMLVVSWGETIHFYRFNEVIEQIEEFGQSREAFTKIGEYRNPFGSSVVFLSSVKANKVSFIDSKLEYFLIHTGSIGEETELSEEDANEKNTKEGKRPMRGVLMKAPWPKELGVNGTDLERMIVNESGGKSVIFCDGVCLNRVQFFEFQECIERMKGQGEWLKALKLLWEVYNGESLMYGDSIDAKEEKENKVKEELMDVCQKYARLIMDSKQIEEDYETPCNILVDTLLNCQLGWFLFGEVSESFEAAGHFGKFADSLEPFILSQKITVVPEDFLEKLSSHFAKTNKKALLEALLISLSIQEHDHLFLTRICIEYGLFTALIFISPRNGDFTTPMVRLLSEARSFLVKREYRQMVQRNLQFLWYCSISIQGTIFPDEALGEKEHSDALSGILSILFDENVLGFFLKEEPKFTLEVLSQFFDPKLVSKLTDTFLVHPYLRSFSSMLEFLSKCTETHSDLVKSHYYLFLVEVYSKVPVDLDPKVAIATLSFFMEERKQGERYPKESEFLEKIDKLVGLLREYENVFREKLRISDLIMRAAQSP